MPENDYRVEDKALFVHRLNEAPIECGAGRYGYLRETPMEYFMEESREYVRCGHRAASVNLDSLPVVMGDIYRSGIL